MLVVTEALGAAAGSRAPGAVKRQRGQLLLELTCCWGQGRAAAPPGCSQPRDLFAARAFTKSLLPPSPLLASRQSTGVNGEHYTVN